MEVADAAMKSKPNAVPAIGLHAEEQLACFPSEKNQERIYLRGDFTGGGGLGREVQEAWLRNVLW